MITSDNPLATFSIPRVAINGWSLSFEIIMPLIKPANPPVRMPIITPTETGNPRFLTITAHITEQSVITVPTDRSIPPLIIMKVTPKASRPFTAVAIRIPTTLLKVKKYGEAIEKKIKMIIRAPNANNLCMASELVLFSLAKVLIFITNLPFLF